MPRSLTNNVGNERKEALANDMNKVLWFEYACLSGLVVLLPESAQVLCRSAGQLGESTMDEKK